MAASPAPCSTGSPASRRQEPSARPALPSPFTIGAGALPREQLAAGCLFPALGRVRELDLFDFGVFGEETFNGCRLHAWAVRAPAPRAVAADAKGRRKGARDQGLGGEVGWRGKVGQGVKSPLEEGRTARPALRPLGNSVRAGICPWATRRATWRECQGSPHSFAGALTSPKGQGHGCTSLISFSPKPSPGESSTCWGPLCRAGASSPLSQQDAGCLPSRDRGRRNESSYLIARRPTLVCDNWSPFPVICKTEERYDFEKWRARR